MRKVFLLTILSLGLNLRAQVNAYTHPPMILGQEEIVISPDSVLELVPDFLFIHEIDDADRSTYVVLASDGPNYVLNGNLLTPAAGFSGSLHVTVRVDDGEFQSKAYDLVVEVRDPVTDWDYELTGQETAITMEGVPYELGLEQLRVHKVPGDFQAELYVSPDGDDANPGTAELPLKTLSGAKARVREYKAAHGVPAGGITVVFREGEYYMTETVWFDGNDSGLPDRWISYRAYPGERVRFTGSKAIDQEWFEKPPADILLKIKNVEARQHIRMVRLKAKGITEYGIIDHVGYVVSNNPIPPANIFVDGRAMHLCRYPNTENFDDVLTHEGQKVFTSRSRVVKTWENTGDLWIDGALSKPWEWKKNRIQSISDNGVVTMTWDYHSEIDQAEPKMFYFNMIEELDYPGEFFIDRSKGVLYFYPPDSMDQSSDIRISQSSAKFMELNGTDYVRFMDIRFECTRNSAVQLKNGADHNCFLSCEFGGIGLDGIRIGGSGNQVRDTWVHDIGANGIFLDGGSQASLTPARNLVENCRIHDFSQERRAYNPGLTIFGTGQVIRHSEVFNGPHMGMKIKGNNHLLEYNDVHRTSHEYSDMLAIYFNTGNFPLQRGTIIRRNRFHDVSGTWKQSAGVYMDNETCGVLVEENYFHDNVAESSGWSVMVHGGADNIVRKNVFVYASYPFCISLRLNTYAFSQFESRLNQWEDEFQGKVRELHLEHYPELRHYFDDEGVSPDPLRFIYNIQKDAEGNVTNYWDRRTPSTNVFTDNLVYNESDDIFAMSNRDRDFYTVNGFRMIDGVMQENLISGNNHNVHTEPGFNDYEGRDLAFDTASLDPGLRADLPHLERLPFSEMGLYAAPGVTFSDYIVPYDSLELILVEGPAENYTLDGLMVVPDPGYTGELSVPMQVRAANGWSSGVFDFKIEVLAKPVDLPAYILLNPADTLIDKGDTVDYHIELGPGIGPGEIFLYACDPQVLFIDGEGTVTGLKGGESWLIAATADLVYADSMKVRVYEEELPKYIIMSPEDTTIYVGDTLAYTMEIGPGLDPEEVEVYSDNWYILTRDQHGNFIGMKKGEVSLVAHIENTQYRDTTKVTVLDQVIGSAGEIPWARNWSLYPNPVKEWLHITVVEQTARFSVYSPKGELLLTAREPRLDVSRFPAGVYCLRVEEEAGYRIRKFIKL